MNVTPRSDDPHALLRAHGLRATPQRVAVAQLLLKQAMHATPREVYTKLKTDFPSMSQNTVYLTLDHLEQAGLLRRFHIAGRVVFDSNTQMHDHACCSRCGRIMDLPSAGRIDSPDELGKWQVEGQSRLWSGVCPDCIQPPR